MRPLRRRNLGHAAEQSLRWTRAHEHEAVATKDNKGSAAAQPSLPLRRLQRKRLRVAAPARGARAPPGAQRTSRCLRRADGRAEVHQRLREIARALDRHEAFGKPPNVLLGGGQFVFNRVKPCHHPFHIAVDRRNPGIERDRRDRRGGIGPDAGQVGERRLALWKRSTVMRDHRLGAGMQMPRARVIAEPGPQLEHVLERGCRERAHVRPARGKAREIRRDRLRRGLLQHDLGEPNPIRVGPLARHGAPRQRATVAVVPGQEIGRARMARRCGALSSDGPNC